ncbi:MAG: polysaccharide biosynthesis C-terminal domain-containing protein [Bacteroidales bacterium]|nr:polysaccharide biosynthesis C-terminal domain-containing protein [Bacteroidales bacterium]
MIRRIVSTTASRLLTALVNLAIVWLSARSLGAEGMGTISLIILGISINQMISALVGGSALVYLVPRHPLRQLLMPAWIWAIMVSAGGSLLLGLFDLVPAEYITDLFWISLLQSYFTINQNVLLGKEKVFHFNLMAVAQVLLVLLSLGILFVGFSIYTVKSYVTALYISYGIVFLISYLLIFKFIERQKWWSGRILKEAFRFGGYLQAASFMQLFNYRLSYYIIEKYFDRATLGVFSIGVQISESVWIISKSIAMVQYARIANSNDPVYSRDLTAAFIRITAVLTLIILGVLLLLPSGFFVLIFRSDFSGLHNVILSLSGGILAVAISLMLSHYFSGSGRPWHNTISSGIGLVFTLVLGFTLIPLLGITGAGITASVAYTAGMLYQLFVFIRISGAKWGSVFSFNDDFSVIRKFITKETDKDQA